MALNVANLLNLTSQAPGRNLYRYDTTDEIDATEAANYFNNRTGVLNLAKGDRIDVFKWNATVFADASLVVNGIQLIVTNVIPITVGGSVGGQVNTAQVFLASSALSSLL